MCRFSLDLPRLSHPRLSSIRRDIIFAVDEAFSNKKHTHKMKLYLHPFEFTYKNASRHFSYVQQRSTKHTHYLWATALGVKNITSMV
jgi:hypothetical protein